MKILPNLLFALTLLIAGTGIAQEPREITWKDLIPEDKGFDDPFLKLTDDQIYNLSYINRTRMLQERRPDALTVYSEQEIDSMAQQLAEEGIDVEYYLSIRDEIRKKRKIQSESVVTELNGIRIRMAGFLLALDFSDKMSTEFLLVPYVGACIHEPTPAKNQIVYFKYPKGYKFKSRYVPVWVEGELIVGDSQNTLGLVDGSDQVLSGYSLKASKIEPYNE